MKYPRYQKYRDTGIEWLGQIPEHWSVVPLFTELNERDIRNTGNIVSDVLSLSYGRIIPRDVETNMGLLPASFETYQIVDPGNLILRLTDLQNDKRSLRVGLVKQRGIITSAYVGLESSGSLNPEYAYYLLHGYDLLKVFYAQGGGVRQSMKYSDLKRLPLVLPPPQERVLISGFLESETARIDMLIAKQQQLIELLQEKRQALISHAVTKGLNPDAPMKDSGYDLLKRVPAHWRVARLKFLADVRSGVAKGRSLDGKDTLEVPYLRVANVQDGYLDLSDVATIEIGEDELERYSLMVGDVLMNEGGDNDKLGRGDIWRGEIEPCIHQNHVFAVRPHAIDSEWLNLVTSAEFAKAYFQSKAKQSTNLASISSSNLRELPVPIPPQSERQTMLESVRQEQQTLDRLMEKCIHAIQILQERRTALISAAVTGKIDVRSLVN